jgi:hypothetical protein
MSAISETIKAFYALWSSDGPPKNQGLWFGVAMPTDQYGIKVLPPFATFNVVSGKVIPTMSTTYDDLSIEVRCYSDRVSGATVAQELSDYATGIYHRVFLTLGGTANNAGTLKQSTSIGYWNEKEKLYVASATFRAISGTAT